MDKKEARAVIRARKREMTKAEIAEKSQMIMDKLARQSCFLEAETLYCYVSYNQEVMTKPLIQRALQAGKKVAVPKVIGNEIEFIYIHSLEDLEAGYQGIEEPVGNEIANEKEVFMIMPGLAFDTSCNRVGYGGGFYDRYLEKHRESKIKKIAVAFDFQVLDNLEMEECDWLVDGIITEARMIGG